MTVARNRHSRCWSCGAEIQHATARRNFGRCRPCAKKGWYGRLWEIVTRTSPSTKLGHPDAAAELRRWLGIPATVSLSTETLLDDLERAHVGARIDWRSDPAEILAGFRKLPSWSEPAEGRSGDSAEDVVRWLARAYRGRGLQILNLEPGGDGWFLVPIPAERTAEAVALARRAGLGKPDVL